MPKLSEDKIKRIKEELLSVLFDQSPKPILTSHLAREIIRDEEFTLKLLKDLKQAKLIKEIKKNSQGKEYLSRRRWILTKEVYSQYKDLSI